MFGADAFRGVVPALIGVGVAIGFVLFVVVPWLWGLLRPLIHAATA
jgi:hypothetical protein